MKASNTASAVAVEESSAETSLRRLCARFARPQRGRASLQILNSAIPFALLWWLMAKSIEWGWNYGLTLLFIALATIENRGCGTRAPSSSKPQASPATI